jgi:hypothetical protein
VYVEAVPDGEPGSVDEDDPPVVVPLPTRATTDESAVAALVDDVDVE